MQRQLACNVIAYFFKYNFNSVNNNIFQSLGSGKNGGLGVPGNQIILFETGICLHFIHPPRSLSHGGGEEMMAIFIAAKESILWIFRTSPTQTLSCNKSLKSFPAACLIFFLNYSSNVTLRFFFSSLHKCHCIKMYFSLNFG